MIVLAFAIQRITREVVRKCEIGWCFACLGAAYAKCHSAFSKVRIRKKHSLTEEVGGLVARVF